MSAICTDEDVALVDGAVRASDIHVFGVLVKGHNLLAKMDALTGDLTPEQVVQFWAGGDVSLVPGTALKEKKTEY